MDSVAGCVLHTLTQPPANINESEETSYWKILALVGAVIKTTKNALREDILKIKLSLNVDN